MKKKFRKSWLYIKADPQWLFAQGESNTYHFLYWTGYYWRRPTYASYVFLGHSVMAVNYFLTSFIKMHGKRVMGLCDVRYFIKNAALIDGDFNEIKEDCYRLYGQYGGHGYKILNSQDRSLRSV